MKNKKNLYLAWLITSAFGLLLICRMYCRNDRKTVFSPASIKTGQKVLLLDSTGSSQLLSLVPVKHLALSKNCILIAKDTLPFVKDTLNGVVLKVPKHIEAWKNFLIAWVGSASPSDPASGWTTTKYQLTNNVQRQLDSLNNVKNIENIDDDLKLCIALIVKLEQGDKLCIYDRKLRPNTFEVRSIKTNDQVEIRPATDLALVNPKFILMDWFLVFFFIASIASGVFFTSQQASSPIIEQTKGENLIDDKNEESITDVAESKDIVEELNNSSTEMSDTVTIAEESNEENLINDKSKETLVEVGSYNIAKELVNDNVTIPDIDAIKDKLVVLEKYMEGFNQKYGGFYSRVQQLSIKPTEEEKKLIKQELVEMGLHAFSIVRAYQMNNLSTPIKEPNLLLILENKNVKELPIQAYRPYIHDAEKMEKRFSILLDIIQEIGIDKLDALLSDVYLSEAFLTEQK